MADQITHSRAENHPGYEPRRRGIQSCLSTDSVYTLHTSLTASLIMLTCKLMSSAKQHRTSFFVSFLKTKSFSGIWQQVSS